MTFKFLIIQYVFIKYVSFYIIIAIINIFCFSILKFLRFEGDILQLY
jgi:hypothetical protein